MAIGAKKTTKTASKPAAAKAKKKMVTIGSLRRSSYGDDQFYISAAKDSEKYKAAGKLLFQEAETGHLYLINTISLYDPHPNAVAAIPGLEKNLVLNLEPDSKAVTLLGESEASSEDSGDDTEYGSADFDDEE